SLPLTLLSSLPLHFFSYHDSPPPRPLHPFPTRRSSDLVVSSTSGGTRISTSIASSTSATPATVPTPSTWPCTKCPPKRSPKSRTDRKSTRLNSSHEWISYAVFCLKKKKKKKAEQNEIQI